MAPFAVEGAIVFPAPRFSNSSKILNFETVSFFVSSTLFASVYDLVPTLRLGFLKEEDGDWHKSQP